MQEFLDSKVFGGHVLETWLSPVATKNACTGVMVPTKLVSLLVVSLSMGGFAPVLLALPRNFTKILDIFHSAPNKILSLLRLWELGGPTFSPTLLPPKTTIHPLCSTISGN